MMVLSALALASIILMNLFVNFALPSLINGAQEDVTIRYRRAWLFWPGRVWVKDAVVIGHDSKAEWLLTIEDVSTGIEILPLLHMTFAAHDAETKNVHFRLRVTRPLKALCAPEAAALPLIPGLAQPGLPAAACLAQVDTAQPSSGRTDPNKLWRVDLRRMAVQDLRELWVESARYVGHAELTGGMYFWPALEMTVHPMRLHASSGELKSGETPILSGLELDLEGRLDRLEFANFDRIYDQLSLTSTLTGKLEDLRAYSRYLPKGSELLIRAGTATVSAQLSVLDSGRTQGTLKLRTSGLRVDYRALELRGTVELSGRLARGDDAQRAYSLRGTKLRLSGVSANERGEKVAQSPWWATLSIERSRIAPSGSPAAELKLSVRLKDLRPLWAVYGVEHTMPDWVAEGLSGEGASGSLHLEVGPDLLRLDGIELKGEGIRAEAMASVERGHTRGALLLGHGPLTLSLIVDDKKSQLYLLDATNRYRQQVDRWLSLRW